MKKNKILSIVIPTYNVEKYLDRCIISLVHDKEALEKIELIIVNDGSRDNSLAIAKRYEQQYPDSIIAVDKENGGHGSTINAGLKLATGKYFRVIDSDDWVNIDDFGKYVQRLESVDTDIVLTNYSREMVYDGTKVLCKYKGLEYDHLYNLNKMDLKLLGDDYLYMATSTIKTQKLRDAGLVLDEHTFYVDMEYNIFPIAHLSTFVYMDFDIYRYWIGRPQQSIDAKSVYRNRAHHEKVLKRLVEFYTAEKLSANKEAYVKKIIVLMLNTHYFIYCSQRVSRQDVREIRSFDAWLKNMNHELYGSVSDKFPYIAAYRKTGFFFTHFGHAIFKRISNRLFTTPRTAEDEDKGATT